MTGYAWTRLGGQDAEDGDRAEEMLTVLFDEVMEEYRVEPGAAILGGFSQGGMMTYRNGLIAPERFRGLAALSSRIPEPERLRARLPDDRDQAVFIAHGTTDSMIDVDDARKARQFLEEEGYKPLYKEYAMAHEINQDVLDDLVPWVHDVLEAPSPGTDRPGSQSPHHL
jgi:phospholipase/carboxylesterase